MLSNLFSFLHPREPVRNRTTRFRPPGVIQEEHFNLLASLQMAVRDEDEEGRCGQPSSAAEMLHGANDPNLRKQGRLCLTFALKNHNCASPPEKIRIANELEESIDAAYSEEDYRHRIYRIGGYLNENQEIFRGILTGRISPRQVAVAGNNDLSPPTPICEKVISEGMATGWC